MEGAKSGWISLTPIVVMLVVYLGGALLVGDFYRMPIWGAFLVAVLYALFLLKGYSFERRIKVFAEGAASRGILYMIAIFCLAGVFAASAKSMGAVDATVSLSLSAIPSGFLPIGIFLASCFISMSIGTSVGTIVALTPVVAEMQAGYSSPWLVAIVVGGAFFGDNLSFISDTTIAATQTQGCRMSDKFKTNFLLVLPAAVVTICLYLWGNQVAEIPTIVGDVEWIKVLPYVLVILLAVLGVNVLLVLLVGIVAADVVGLSTGAMSWIDTLRAVGMGLESMYELILVTLLAGGLMSMVKCAGGFDYLINRLTKNVNSRRGTEGAVVALTALTNLCTANNTIAILTAGPIARDLSQRYSIPPRRTASLMDTTSCFVQGIIPYGAQLLMASGLAGITPFSIIPHLYYPMLIGLMVVLSICFQKNKLS
ncbi:MAG: Na+/H+ antiporter NhaC family protein [Rikenellaceae bacterium]|nr:Na+/H+ antiporter NhaC family protein [Rikenellaceae bacterium]